MAFKMRGSSLYGSPMKKYASDAQRKAIWASKNESGAKMKDNSPMLKKDCNCWEGYKRVAGTKPCAKGSCTKA